MLGRSINMHHLITPNDLSDQAITIILKQAAQFKQHGYAPTLTNKVIATLFFEPSTRTRLSFETAVLRSDGQVITMADPHTSSFTKGETLEDTIRIVSGYADAIVMRYPEAGAADRAAKVSTVPIINAGDGANAHPSQTLIDLFAIQQVLGRLQDFTITMVADLKYSRVAHSLAETLFRFNGVKQLWVAPDELVMPTAVRDLAKQKQIVVAEQADYRSVLSETDILLMTRVQQERFTDKTQYERLKDRYVLTTEDLATAKSSMKIIAPLPRTYELPKEIDVTPYAYYFQQAADGVPVRAAILEYCLGI
jgi:aspartate carbamoyltransferase catalytic subunit